MLEYRDFLLLITYIYLFKVPYDDKQSIATKLDIKLLKRDIGGR